MLRFRSFLCFALTLILAACAKQAPPKQKQDTGPVAVRSAPVTVKQVQRVVETVGTLFPFDEVIVSAEIDGRVDKVNFDLGDAVRTGDILVSISDEEQRYLVAQNEAQLRQSMERLGLKNEKDKVQDIDATPEVRRAKADLEEAEQRHRRIRSLVDQKIGAQADLDAAAARNQAMLAAFDATRNQTRNLIQEVERFKAVLDLQRKKLRDTSVRAPFNANVKERQVTMGQYVRANTPLFTLVKTNPVRLRLEVPERLAPWTKVNQPADVTVEAYQDRHFRGKVWRIAPTVDQTKRTFIVEVLIDNPDGALKAGSYAKARLATEKVDDILLVPVRSVAYILGANKAFVIHDGTIEAREVRTGDRFDQQLEIVEGLRAGELVAVTQLNRLDSGVKVRIQTADEQKGGGKGPAQSQGKAGPTAAEGRNVQAKSFD
jgi:RND family efflux transporter MFP subunit